MCLWIEAEDHAFQNGGVDGHTWARRYVDPLRVHSIFFFFFFIVHLLIV